MKLNLKTKKILLVEDYSIMRIAIKEMLFQLEARVIVEADNANTALVAMEKEKFEIVLCDYNLGAAKNGQQLLEEAKHRKLLPITSIFIMVTAEQTQSMVLSAMDNKPDDYLTKPFNAQQLISRIEKHFQRKAYFALIDKAIEKGNITTAIAHCEELLAQNDPRMRTPVLKICAELAIKVGDLSKAERYYREILEQRELAWARQGLGVIAFLHNDFELAIQHFQQVLSYSPMMMESYDWLAKTYETLGKTEDAKNIINKAVDLSPQAILRQQKLANLADKTEDLEVARSAYKSAIRLGHHSVHKSSADFSGLASVYCKTNDTKEALKIISVMRKEFQNDPEAEIRATIQEIAVHKVQNNTELMEAAYANLQQVSELCPKLPNDLALDLAKAHYENGHPEAAHALLDPLIKNNVDDELFINNLRAMNKLVGNENQSDHQIQSAKKVLIDINNNGVSLFKQGKIPEALALLDDAAAKMPDNRTIQLNIATILIQDMKRNGITKEKLIKTNQCIEKAKLLGAAYERLSTIQMEFTKLTQVPKN